MTQKNTSFIFFVKLAGMLFVLNLLVSCASGVGGSVKITDDDVAKYAAMSAEDAVNSLESSLADAKEENLPFYTPTYYREAEKLYLKAQALLKNNKSRKNIIQDVAKGDRLLAKARIKKREVESELDQLLKINSNLVKLDAPTVFKKPYAELKKKLTELIVKIEENKADKIEKDKSKLLKSFTALEVKSIKYAALNEANNIRSQAKAKKAPKLAPKTYAEAVRVYQQADADISQNPHDEETVMRAKKRALFSAIHALNVTNRVIELGQKFKKSPEDVVLDEEARLLSISNALDQSDLRDQAIDEQVSALVSLINELSRKSASSEKNQARIADLEKRLSETEASLALSNKDRDQAKAELEERNNLMVKMTADLVKLQNKEKELISLLAHQNAEAFNAKPETKNSNDAGGDKMEKAAAAQTNVDEKI
ncbi:MAG TPA: hypothetical protein ENK06_10110 [Gammaproteobacteria bacterium]|nr:hypothetical protein [Gammaproteobacteria bacterium]